MQTKISNKTLLKIFIPLILMLSYILIPKFKQQIQQITMIFSSLSVEQVKGYILSFGIFAPIVSFLLMIFQSIAAPLPAFLITFANAALFGWVNGAILSWSSAMAGAAICFYIGRLYGRKPVEKLTSKKALESVDIFFDRYGKHGILIARLLPFISFDIISYASGLTSISFLDFFVATGIGQLPATIIYSYVGTMLTGGSKMFITGLLIIFALSIFVFLIKNIVDDRKNKELQKSSNEKIIL